MLCPANRWLAETWPLHAPPRSPVAQASSSQYYILAALPRPRRSPPQTSLLTDSVAGAFRSIITRYLIARTTRRRCRIVERGALGPLDVRGEVFYRGPCTALSGRRTCHAGDVLFDLGTGDCHLGRSVGVCNVPVTGRLIGFWPGSQQVTFKVFVPLLRSRSRHLQISRFLPVGHGLQFIHDFFRSHYTSLVIMCFYDVRPRLLQILQISFLDFGYFLP